MDFGTLLHKAQKNDQTTKKEIKYYSTKFEPPKKQQRSKTLSVNIQKFLARKEEEEKVKLDEARKRRDQLLELRSKDKKATRRVSVMLKRTKSANQSVIQDAVDKDNTAVTLAGPSQPDEDDYGYVSQSAADFYNKMMEKYSKMPDEPKFQLGKKKVSTNLNSTKDRVKAALEKEKEEASQPHRRKRKHHQDSESSTKDEVEEREERVEKKEEKPPKPKLKAAPVINFSELLKLAEKKQFEPIVIEQKKEEEERLLTKKQKRELEKEREYREGKEKRQQAALQGNMPPPAKIPKQGERDNRIPKVNGDSRPQKSESDNRAQRPTSECRPQKVNGENRIQKQNSENKMPKISNLNEKIQKVPRSEDDKSKFKQPYPSKPDDRCKMGNKATGNQGRPDNTKRPDVYSNNDKLKQRDQKQFRPIDQGKPKTFPPQDLKPKRFPPDDVRPRSLPPKDQKLKQIPPPGVRPNPAGMRRKPLISKGKMYDDDEDYDSEMDDFIDDGPDEEEDYSKYISEIFGYDKKKYRYADDDVDNMESTFAQQMREEVISTKIGIMEDLEDMKQEEQDKRKKALMKKKMKR